jgi:hypothetical protein
VRLSKRWEVRGVREKCIEERRRCVAPGRGCPVWGERGDFFSFFNKMDVGLIFYFIFLVLSLFIYYLFFLWNNQKNMCAPIYFFTCWETPHLKYFETF